jgi:hypothetical protein
MNEKHIAGCTYLHFFRVGNYVNQSVFSTVPVGKGCFFKFGVEVGVAIVPLV